MEKVFSDLRDINPEKFREEELQKISKFYWEKQNFAPTERDMWFDFRDEKHLYALCNLYFEMEGEGERSEALDFMPKNTSFLIKTLEYYLRQAPLNEVQRDVLERKMNKEKNDDIAIAVNARWHKTYTSNYISTIFTQRILPKVAEAARQHQRIIENLPFNEEFKYCTKCGQLLLRDSMNFTKKQKSSDGFASRCKCCEKTARKGE